MKDNCTPFNIACSTFGAEKNPQSQQSSVSLIFNNNKSQYVIHTFVMLLTLLCLFQKGVNAQTTYDFTTNATLVNTGYWKTQANITIGGVAYKLTCGGNGSFANAASGGASNSKCLIKDGSGGDQFTLERADGEPFQFYGLWVKHQSMNSYSSFYSLPPFYTVTFNKTSGAPETYNDNTAMQGGNTALTTSEKTFTKDLTVTSVSISFKAIIYFWIDNIIVGPAAAANPPAITAHPVNRSICAGSNTTFSVTATDASTYQWQVNTGAGFSNVSNGGVYSGATSRTLSINGATAGMNGYLYRCVASGSTSPAATSNAGTLSIATVSLTSALQTNIACNGGSTGAASVNIATGGTGPYTYNWTPGNPTGDGTTSVTGLTAGTWTCTATDANSCTGSVNFTITQPAAISLSPSGQTNVACNGGSNGAASVAVATGGTGPYTYNWTPGNPTGDGTTSVTGLSAGVWTCTVTDANSCTKSVNFTITQPTALSLNAQSQTNIACNGASNGAASVSVATGGAGGYTYNWTPGNPTGDGTTSVSGLAAGTWTCTVTDANACTTQKNFTITQPAAALSATTSKIDVSCNGGSNGSASVSATGGTAGYSYSWAPMGGTAATATGLPAGTYTCTITDINECSISKTITINQPTPLAAMTSRADVSCNGGSDGMASVTVNGGTAGYSYSWSPVGGTAATATGLSAGTYTCTITDANFCQINKTITINEPAKITVTAANQTICSGEQTSISLSSTPAGASFNWTVSAVSGTVTGASASGGGAIQQTLSGSGVIKYTITPTDGGCTGTAKEVLVTVNALTVFTEQPSGKLVDEGETASFSTAATNASSYQWQVDMGSGFTNVSNGVHYSGATTATLTVNDALEGMNGYTFRCVATGNCQPVSSNNAVLNVRLRTPQTISFSSTDEKVYGDADFAPAATSDAGLEISYSSSDETIATIEDGKVHIKKAGQVTITANQAGNSDYKPASSVQQVLTILKRKVSLALNALPAIEKKYDGNTGIELASANYVLANTVEGDEVNVTGTANFEDSKAGQNKIISVNTFVLGGEDRDNYELITSASEVTGTITRKSVEVSLLSVPVINKTYDGTVAATLVAENYSLSGIVGEDNVVVDASKATYDDKNAAGNKVVTVSEFVLGGEQKDNYTITTVSAQTNGAIAAKAITLSFANAPMIAKIYDGTLKASVPAEKYQLQGLEEGDDVTVTGIATYENKLAGEDKLVTVQDFELAGNDRNNYHLTQTEVTTTGNIQQAILTVELNTSPVVSKVYDGNTNASLAEQNYTIVGIVAEDKVAINYPASGTYEDAHGGEQKKITVTGLILSGQDATNYQLAATTISGSVGAITKKAISITAMPQTKIYGTADPELTYTAEGKLENDQLSGSLQRAEGKDVGSYSIAQGDLSGGDDYEIESFVGANLQITPASLVITPDDKTKKQGTVNPTFTFRYDGLAEGDQPTDLDAQPVAATSAGSGSPIGYYDIEASGAASGNYEISYSKGKLTVIPADNAEYSVKVWSSNPNTLTVKIYTTVAQKAAIILYTEVGQQVILEQHQLNIGINTYQVSVGNLASSTYVLAVAAEKFKDAQKVKVK